MYKNWLRPFSHEVCKTLKNCYCAADNLLRFSLFLEQIQNRKSLFRERWESVASMRIQTRVSLRSIENSAICFVVLSIGSSSQPCLHRQPLVCLRPFSFSLSAQKKERMILYRFSFYSLVLFSFRREFSLTC